jgi:Na+/H+-dicarboxylate symporter
LLFSIALLARIPFKRFLRAVAYPLTIAFATGSSEATLPRELGGHVVAPRIFSHTLRINPLLVIFALLLGLQLYGIIGALVALPILSVLRETAIYLHRHLELEPWERSPGGLL